LKHFLEEATNLEGEWVKKDSGYEREFADRIGAELNRTRFWDCVWKGLNLELKKGKNGAWLDLVRYSLYMQEPANEPVLALFLFYKGTKITLIFGATTRSLIEALRLDEKKANTILELNNGSLHPLNVQLRLGRVDVQNIAEFEVTYVA
jgi:hypothetical protein